MNSNTKKLTVSAVMIALAAALSFVKVWQMPLGGAVTLFSMLPVVIVSVMLGIKWGLAASFVYSLVQMAIGIMLDGILGWGLSPAALCGTILLDYLLPFSALGVAGAFEKRGNTSFVIGTGFVIAFRFFCHFLSGIVIFPSFCPWLSGDTLSGIAAWKKVWIYSLCYNGAFMLPELVLTVLGLYLLLKTGAVERVKKMVK